MMGFYSILIFFFVSFIITGFKCQGNDLYALSKGTTVLIKDILLLKIDLIILIKDINILNEDISPG